MVGWGGCALPNDTVQTLWALASTDKHRQATESPGKLPGNWQALASYQGGQRKRTVSHPRSNQVPSSGLAFQVSSPSQSCSCLRVCGRRFSYLHGRTAHTHTHETPRGTSNPNRAPVLVHTGAGGGLVCMAEQHTHMHTHHRHAKTPRPSRTCGGERRVSS